MNKIYKLLVSAALCACVALGGISALAAENSGLIISDTNEIYKYLMENYSGFKIESIERETDANGNIISIIIRVPTENDKNRIVTVMTEDGFDISQLIIDFEPVIAVPDDGGHLIEIDEPIEPYYEK